MSTITIEGGGPHHHHNHHHHKLVIMDIGEDLIVVFEDQ
jgi:hypothetical protein